MTNQYTPGLNDIPVGCVVTNASREITFYNSYLVDQFGWAPAPSEHMDFEWKMTRASHIFCDSYIYPMLLASKVY